MKMLFFSPYSAIWSHAYPEYLLASALEQGGHDVVQVTCGRVFESYCVSMAARHLTFEAEKDRKLRVCEECVSVRSLIRAQGRFPGYDLSERLTKEDFREAEAVLARVDRENFLQLDWREIPIGKIATLEVLLHRKKNNFDFNDSEWKYYLSNLRNALLSAMGAFKILEKERPDAIVLYDSTYSALRPWRLIAEKMGIKTYMIKGGMNFLEIHSTLNIVKETGHFGLQFFRPFLEKWPAFKEIAAPKTAIESVSRHFQHLFSGSGFVFSPKKQGINVREKFKIPSDKKLILATLSSYDEVNAAETIGFQMFYEPKLFQSQIQWVQTLVKRLAGREDVFLLVRPHPREYPAKGSKVLSDHARQLKEVLSLYDVIEETDVVLNAWSTVGSEVPLFGLPVVTYMRLPWYPAELNFVGESEDEYFKKIDEALTSGWSEDRVKLAFRWYCVLFYWGVLDLSRWIPHPEFSRAKRLLALLKSPRDLAIVVIAKCLALTRGQLKALDFKRSLLLKRRLPQDIVNELSGLFRGNNESLLEVRESLAGGSSPREEDRLIRKAVGEIAMAMGSTGREVSPLRRKMLAFSQRGN